MFKSTSRFDMAGRGRMVTVANPGGYPDPAVLLGETVLIDGVPCQVKGVETFAIALPYPESLDFALLT